MRILIGVDGSPYSEAALQEVARRTWPEGSEIRIVHAFEMPLAPTTEVWFLPAEYYEQMDTAVRAQAESIVTAALETLKANLISPLTIEGVAVMGSARGVLIDEARNWQADLIVVGSHGYPTWERLLLGSVSHAVVSHAPCCVEVVRLRPVVQAAA